MNVFVKDGRLRPIIRMCLFVFMFYFGIGGMSVALALLNPLFGRSFPNPKDMEVASFYFTVSAPIVTIIFALLFRRFLDRRSLASLGLALQGRWWVLFAAGLSFAALLQIPSLSWAAIEHRPWNFDVLPYDVRFEAWLGVPNGILILAPIVLSAVAFDYAILGYLFQNMWEEWGVVAAISMATILYLVSGFGTDISMDAIWPAAVVATMTVILGLTVVWTGSIWFALGFHIVWNAIVDPTGSQPYYALQFAMLIVGFLMLLVARRRHVVEFKPPREAYAAVTLRPRD